MKRLQVVIVTGLSGAGKSTALRACEDLVFFCVDNLPAFLLSQLLATMASRTEGPGRLAIGMDVRDQSFPDSLVALLPALRHDHDLEILFVEADDQILLRRFSEMRRPHPLAAGGTVREGIGRERQLLAALCREADLAIDTSSLSPHALRDRIRRRYGKGGEAGQMRLLLLTFGFKHGVPAEADLLFDVRFLPNPHYVPALKEHTGLEPEVAAHALDNDDGRRFLELLHGMLLFLIPLYQREGKSQLTVGIGCTGGRHRSVAVAAAIRQRLSAVGQAVLLAHRELAEG
ncbi:MAG: RNase adapter RapZ [Desulfobulbaceae bacterium]|nr:RNase adapter RapZ [Desulfobulbaceae bacterium]